MKLASCITGAMLAIGVVGATAAEPAKEGAADAVGGEYVGTYHPPKPACTSCHAKATISREDTKYTLKVVIDYSARKKNAKAKDNRFITIEGAEGEDGLVFTNKKYKVTVTDDEIIGERLDKKAKVKTVLKLKRPAVDEAEAAKETEPAKAE